MILRQQSVDAGEIPQPSFRFRATTRTGRETRVKRKLARRPEERLRPERVKAAGASHDDLGTPT